jgi:hypothetical protein
MRLSFSFGCAAAALLTVACGNSTPSPTCQDIVTQYEAEIPDASFCDPTDAASCGPPLLP